jgi:hypothetical protein
MMIDNFDSGGDMPNPPTTKAFKAYYDNYISKVHPNPSLISRWGEDPSRFETQILCQKMGEPIPDTKMWEQDGETFGPTRWPYNAMSDPNYSDPPIQYIIEKRLKAIGTTWWDWKNKKSIGLGFDFDSITHHASNALHEWQIDALDKLDLPWLEIVRSTRGSGRHLYVWFEDPPTTANHCEHAAIARALLPVLGKEMGMDLEGDVDCFGSIMWIYHTSATKENHGYEQIKPATQTLPASMVPPNWRDHIEVVSGGRSKVRVQGWTPDGTTKGDELDEMTQAYSKTHLDETHLKILEDLEATGHTALWVHDHHLWQGHTMGLKQVFDEWAEAGTPMRGLFDTNSLDSDPGKPNCFMRPKPNGAWDVYRFGEGVEEHPLWDKQGKWTHTTYNFPATLKQICLACGGYEGTEEKQGFMFSTMDELKQALALLQSKMTLPDKAAGRTLSLHPGMKGQTILCVSKKRGDEQGDFPRFVKTPRGWEKAVSDAIETSDKEIKEETLWSELDEKLRALKVAGKFDCWVMHDDQKEWIQHPRENIKSFLFSEGYAKPDPILGSAVFKSWKVITDPFKPEYPGGRIWNRNAAQFMYDPVDLNEGEVPKHPTWDRLMQHCGIELNDYIPNISWCKNWGITNGGDYLTAWVACMFQNPFGKLPYLFMYGPQNSGKSSFHEGVSLLLTKGVVKADRALTSEQGYNGELAGAILAVVDEVDISKAGSAVYNKIKEWTTGLTISIHAKYRPVEDLPSTLHFCQMANSRSSLPVFPGDSRVTAMNVPSLEEEIPRDRLHELLKEEAPHFMRTLMDFEIPEATGRLMLPIIETVGKMEAASNNTDELEQFIQDNCYQIPGCAVKLSEFKKRFHDSIEEFQRIEWSSHNIRKRLNENYLVGRGSRVNQVLIGNMSFKPDATPSSPYVKEDGRLKKDEL